MPTNYGVKDKKILVQNLKNQLMQIKQLINERLDIPKDFAQKTTFFYTQDNINRMLLDSLRRIEDILSVLVKNQEFLNEDSKGELNEINNS